MRHTSSGSKGGALSAVGAVATTRRCLSPGINQWLAERIAERDAKAAALAAQQQREESA